MARWFWCCGVLSWNTINHPFSEKELKFSFLKKCEKSITVVAPHTHTHTSSLPLCILSSTEKPVLQQRDRERRKAVWLQWIVLNRTFIFLFAVQHNCGAKRSPLGPKSSFFLTKIFVPISFIILVFPLHLEFTLVIFLHSSHASVPACWTREAVIIIISGCYVDFVPPWLHISRLRQRTPRRDRLCGVIYANAAGCSSCILHCRLLGCPSVQMPAVNCVYCRVAFVVFVFRP